MPEVHTTDRAIFCILGQLVLAKDEFGDEKLPEECAFTWYNKILGKYDDELFCGIHVNEAPVKALLKAAHQSGKDVTEINYLLSNKCAGKTAPIEVTAGLTAFADYEDDCFSAEGFFIRRIEEYCSEKGYVIPTFNPIPYTPRWPTDSLEEINNFLDKGYELAIDITGGRKDAVLLEALTIQLLKLKESDSALKAMVYGSYEDRHIIDQKPTFDFISLINAVESFINYGKADRLYDFFITGRDNWKHVSPETRHLLDRMRDFSNSLALCQVEKIGDLTQEVQDALQATRENFKKKEYGFEKITEAMTAFDMPNSWWLFDRTLGEILQDIEEDEQIAVDIPHPGSEGFRAYLEEQRKPYMTIRSELILQYLIPTIQKRFIPEAQSKTDLILEIVTWCTQHQMIQQALCIFQENISECLFELGYFEKKEAFNRLRPREKSEAISRIAVECCPAWKPTPGHYLCFPEHESRQKNSLEYSSLFAIKRSDELPSIIAWCHYIRGIRNSIMHADSIQRSNNYKFARRYLGKNTQDLSVETLANDILEAVGCVKEPAEFNIAKWNKALCVYKTDKGQRRGKPQGKRNAAAKRRSKGASQGRALSTENAAVSVATSDKA